MQAHRPTGGQTCITSLYKESELVAQGKGNVLKEIFVKKKKKLNFAEKLVLPMFFEGCLDVDKRIGRILSITEGSDRSCWPCEFSWRLIITTNICYVRDTILNAFTPLFLKGILSRMC